MCIGFAFSNQVFAQTLFMWPVQPMPSYSEVAGYYVTNNFVDQNNTIGILDWNCQTRTYNGHAGIDIDLWPFTWSMMDNNHVAVVAGASGRVVQVVQNNSNENNCGQPGENTTGNYIAIRHADSSTSFYFHIRDNSALVTMGQNVIMGQPLAFAGSSGFSSNPHLHFEVNNLSVTFPQTAGLVDPYAGNCNNLNPNSWWLNQKPYREPAVVRVMTHGSAPSLPGYDRNPAPGWCRAAEVKNDKASFAPNDSIYVGVAMRDYLRNQSFTLTVHNPDGSVWFTETHNNNTDYGRRYYTFGRRVPGNAQAGTYRAVVAFNGSSATHFFSVSCPAVQNVTGMLLGHIGFKASTFLTASSALPSGHRLLLQAGSQIRLLPGFAAQQGSVMKARIRDCNYSE